MSKKLSSSYKVNTIKLGAIKNSEFVGVQHML